jgi:hypothetical protein
VRPARYSFNSHDEAGSGNALLNMEENVTRNALDGYSLADAQELIA